MKNKILTVTILLSLIFLFNANKSFADDLNRIQGMCGENAVWTYNKETKTLIVSGNGTVTTSDISLISDNINTLVVEGSINTIGENAFKGIKVSKIQLKEGIRKIESYAFYNCIGPKQMVIPKSVTDIGSGIFELSQGFNKITILGDVSVGVGTFGSLYSPVDTLEVAGKINNIANTMVSSESSAPEIKFVNKNKNYVVINDIIMSKDKKVVYALNGRKDVTKIEIPENVKVIGNSAFAFNQLKKLNIEGNNLIKIRKEAFYENEEALKNVVLHNYPQIEKKSF
ncbi:MAG: leucine-rich repeat domain-containing protein [Eubacterium sp.]|nr:leucine-rich repeat domain-containing protein [Eubacterium sp.]